ncbi:unnamed protein product [Colletotrichum noveboracense]|uniref:Uncharacterized protein n=1 Tax=Colletotrichum noveboracense TaxID=2664923 RepID=A0A9W4W6U6_9PEZI|nr:unnamed protein product [Colletotrichum noveboracense]
MDYPCIGVFKGTIMKCLWHVLPSIYSFYLLFYPTFPVARNLSPRLQDPPILERDGHSFIRRFMSKGNLMGARQKKS